MNRISITLYGLILFACLSGFNASGQTAIFTSDVQSGCIPLFVNFNGSASTGSPTSYIWDFGDGTGPGSGALVSHTYQFAGTYDVTLTVSNGGGSDVEIKTGYITVFRNPTADFTLSDDSICPGTPINLVSTSTPGDGVINHFSWSFNDGSPQDTLSGGTVSHTYTNGSGTVQMYTPVLVISDTHGCNGTRKDTVWVFPIPNAGFTVDPFVCTPPATVSFTNTSSNASGLYTWDFGDLASGAQNTSTQANPSHTFNVAGSYTITLTAGISGCNDVASTTISVIQPVANFTVDTTLCQYDTAFFTNTSTPAGANIIWNFGDFSSPNNISFQQNPSHAYNTPGTYTVTATISSGSCTSTFSRNILVNNRPTASFTSPDPFGCDTAFAVTFNETTGGITGWQWNFGDPGSGSLNTSSAASPTHSYHVFGYYDVSLIVTDANGCKDTATTPNFVQVVDPLINFTAPDSGCLGKVFSFTPIVNSPADPGVASYVWNFHDGTGNHTVAGGFTTHTFTAPGVYDVTLTITTTSGCVRTLTKTGFIRVGTPPNAAFTGTPTNICFHDPVQFTDLTPAPVTGWHWFFGDGGESMGQSPVHYYNIDTSRANPFDVVLIAYYNGCADTDTVHNMITVRGPIPDYRIIYDCANPYFVSFSNISAGASSYNWNFGDGTTSTVTSPTHTYATNSDFAVTLSATSSFTGCVVDTTYLVQVRDPIPRIIANPTSICYPGTVNFIGSTSQDAFTYEWHFGEGLPNVLDTSKTSDTLHLYNRAGLYTAELIITDLHGCRDTARQVIHMTGPTAAFTATPSAGCAPLHVLFRDVSVPEGGAIASRWWYFGISNPRTVTTDTTSFNYTAAGNYAVTMIVTDVNGCVDTTTQTIRPTKPTASITFANDSNFCQYENALMTGGAGPFAATPITYTWDFGDATGTSGTTNPVTHSYQNNGTYTVHLSITDNNGCVDSISRKVLVYTTPAAFHTVHTDSCVVENGIKKAVIDVTFIVDSTSYATTYDWDLSVQQVAGYVPNSYFFEYSVPPGTYPAQLITYNIFGCSDTAIDPSAVVVPGPTGSFTFVPDSGCRPLTVQFTGSAVNVNLYTWDFGDGTVIAGTPDAVVNHTYTNTGVFTPQFYMGFLVGSNYCYVPAPSTDSVQVTSLLNVNILEDSIMLRDGESDTLHVLVGGVPGPYTYIWNPSNFISADPVPGTFYAMTNEASSYYYVQVPYGSQGCSGLDSVFVFYIQCEQNLVIPNVFTPNSDGKNDDYLIKDLCNVEGFRIIIYNRWGRIMFESTDPTFKWDGKTESGDEASDGTYYFIMHSKSGEHHGFIELIRKKD